MFTVVSSYNNLPSNAIEGQKVFVSLENIVYVFSNNSWIDYEDFVGGFEEIASVDISDDISASTKLFLFENAPVYDNFKFNYLYPIIFTAKEITSLNYNYADFSIVNNIEEEIMSCSFEKLDNINFKIYYHYTPENFNNNEERLDTDVYTAAFNVSVDNCIVKGPASLKLFKPVGV